MCEIGAVGADVVATVTANSSTDTALSSADVVGTPFPILADQLV